MKHIKRVLKDIKLVFFKTLLKDMVNNIPDNLEKNSVIVNDQVFDIVSKQQISIIGKLGHIDYKNMTPECLANLSFIACYSVFPRDKVLALNILKDYKIYFNKNLEK